MVYNPGMSMYRNRNRNNRDTRGSSLPEIKEATYSPPITGYIDDGRALSPTPPDTAFLGQSYIVPLNTESPWLFESGKIAIGGGESDLWFFYGSNF